jgi:hypothetical protein
MLQPLKPSTYVCWHEQRSNWYCCCADLWPEQLPAPLRQHAGSLGSCVNTKVWRRLTFEIVQDSSCAELPWGLSCMLCLHGPLLLQGFLLLFCWLLWEGIMGANRADAGPAALSSCKTFIFAVLVALHSPG